MRRLPETSADPIRCADWRHRTAPRARHACSAAWPTSIMPFRPILGAHVRVLFIVATMLVLYQFGSCPRRNLGGRAEHRRVGAEAFCLRSLSGVLAWRIGGTMRTTTMILAAIATVVLRCLLLSYPREAPFSVRRLFTRSRSTWRAGTSIAAASSAIDIYQPASGDRHPILVQIYGGAWQRGAPGDNASFASYFASRGYAVFAIDYRHAPGMRNGRRRSTTCARR